VRNLDTLLAHFPPRQSHIRPLTVVSSPNANQPRFVATSASPIHSLLASVAIMLLPICLMASYIVMRQAVESRGAS